MVGPVNDHSPWDYDKKCPVCGYDSLWGSRKVHGGLVGVALNIAEYPLE
jgi:hypothetical protein